MFLNHIYDFVLLFFFKRRFESQQSFKKIGNLDLRSIYIILNGPSLRKQDLSKLKGQNLMFVNRGFKHELFKELSPKFHVFVDSKILTGEWSTSWFYDILEMVPDIKFILPSKWMNEDKIRDLINAEIPIIWLPNNLFSPFSCLGVSGACLKFAMRMDFEEIYFTGFDGNGLAYELINSSNSHFYGVNDENNLKTSKEFKRDLYMFSRFFDELNSLSEKARKNKMQIINLTDGGLLDMFSRKNFNEE